MVKAEPSLFGELLVGPEDSGTWAEGVSLKVPLQSGKHILWACPLTETPDSLSNINSVWENMGS